MLLNPSIVDIKGSVGVISSDQPFAEGRLWFTTVTGLKGTVLF